MPHTRPTTDIAKEGLFNILQHRIDIDGIKTLDLFGGTGCISYELASRGAAELTIVEKDSTMHDFIKKNMEMLKVQHCKVLRLDVLVVAVQGQALGIGQSLLKLGGEFVQAHGIDTRK